jgi:hypothetical protein
VPLVFCLSNETLLDECIFFDGLVEVRPNEFAIGEWVFEWFVAFFVPHEPTITGYVFQRAS